MKHRPRIGGTASSVLRPKNLGCTVLFHPQGQREGSRRTGGVLVDYTAALRYVEIADDDGIRCTYPITADTWMEIGHKVEAAPDAVAVTETKLGELDA